jgi:sugar lactone lactonase YvrE
MTSRSLRILVLALLPAGLSAQQESPPDPEEPCPGLTERLEGIEALLARRPGDATLYFYKALFQARCGLAADACATLTEVGRLGDGFLPVADFGFGEIWDDPGFQEVRSELEARLPEVVQSEVAFEAEGADLVPEGIAFDGETGTLYMGSMRHHRILALAPDGSQTTFADADDGLGQILGLAIDAGRRQLLAVDIGPLVADPAERRTGAVVAIDLASGEVVRRLAAEGAMQLNDVTVASDGTLYATDSAAGGLRRAALDSETLDPWLPEVTLPGANGLALADGDATLYLAHSTGLARIEVASGDILPLIANDTRETLGAIDGLYARHGTLYGIQNVTNPGRVIAIDLDDSGKRAVAVRTLLSHHHPALDEPTTGALAGDRLLILANSHVARLQPDGSIRDAETLRSPVVLSIRIGERRESEAGSGAKDGR